MSVPKIALAASIKTSTERPDSQRRFTHCSGPCYCSLSQSAVIASRLFMVDRSWFLGPLFLTVFPKHTSCLPRLLSKVYWDQRCSNRCMTVTLNLHITPRSRMHLCFDSVRVHCVVRMYSSKLSYFITRKAVASDCEAILVSVKNN